MQSEVYWRILQRKISQNSLEKSMPKWYAFLTLYNRMADTIKQIRTRFAPSPTGFVHIGNFRTALFSHLWAKHNNGTSILRIEDTDQSRKVEGAVEHLLDVMKTMGVEYDEGFYLNEHGGIETHGEFGPYLQSERLDVYHKHIDQLLSDKKAYYCFCSEERLAELRKEQTALKKPPMYDRLCKNLSEAELQAKLEEFSREGKNPVVRFAIPEGQTIIHDLIYGDITYDNKVLDDQVLLKSDKFPTYHLAVVVDDHYMQITHVVRGDEWIPSTPKHILLYQAFGWEAPEFAHAPLILNPDKSKLSKRQGDVTVEDYLNKGYLPEALLNFVVFLGWNPKSEQEIFSYEELVQSFELSNVNKSGAVFDINKLDWINGQYLRSKPIGELVDLLVPYWEQEGLFELAGDGVKIAGLQAEANKKYLEAITELEKERLKKLSEIGERTPYFFRKPDSQAVKELLVAKKSTPELTTKGLEGLIEIFEQLSDQDFSQENLETKIKEFIANEGLGNFDVLWPMRVALTGMQASPNPFEVAAVLGTFLGKKEVIERIHVALQA
jgi:nondiscriminating glutamyl-tRNA synthetase